MGLVERGAINPVIYREQYRGLAELPRAMEDLKARRAWGRAILTVDGEAEKAGKARL